MGAYKHAVTLEDIESPFGRIEVVRIRATGGILYRQGNCHQSEADGAGVSLSTYIHAIYGFLQQAEASNVLLIGCGGGALATMLSRQGARLSIVDINEWSFYIARRYFGLPDSVECHVADGAAYVAKPGRKFDSIVFDAYDGGTIPPQFLETEFLTHCRQRLTRDGLFVANVFMRDDSDPVLDTMAYVMRQVWPTVRLLDEPGGLDRNAIAVAGAVDGLRRPRLLMSPASGAGAIRTDLARMKFRQDHGST